MSGKEVARAVSNMLNNFSNDERDEFLAEMLKDHRSLQQSFTRLCCKWFRLLQDQSHDLRNEASVRLAKALMEIIPSHPLPTI